MLTTLAMLDGERGWEDLPGYQRFEYTLRTGDLAGIDGLRRATGIVVDDYVRPAKTMLAAVRFNSMLAIRVSSRAFRVTWMRASKSSRRRFLYLFVQRGTVELHANGSTARISAGWVGIVSPTPGPVVVAAAVDADFVAFTFDREEVGGVSGNSRIVLREVNESAVLRSAASFLIGAVEAPKLSELHESQLFRGLTRDVARALASDLESEDSRDDLVDAARRIIVARATSRLFGVDSLARELAVSRRSLERAFGEQGLSPSGEIRRQRAIAAQELLIDQPLLPVAQVAAASGFGSADVLRRATMRYLDATPAAIRRQALKVGIER